MDRKAQEELQKVLVEAESFKRQLESVSAQLQIYEGVYAEMGSTIESLEHIQESGDGEVLMPLGSDSFVRAKLLDKENVILGVGADISLEGSTVNALSTLKERRDNLLKEIGKLRELVVKINAKQSELNEEYGRLARKLQSEASKRESEK